MDSPPAQFPSTGIVVLEDVSDFFAALREAVLGASESVDLCFFAIQDGEVARNLVAAIENRVLAGVGVRVLLDGMGMLADRMGGGSAGMGTVMALQKAGAQVRLLWGPRRFRWLPPGVFGRLHSKMAIIDASRVLTGGSNVGDWYATTHDTNFDLCGPLAGQCQAYFDEMFSFCRDPNTQRPPQGAKGLRQRLRGAITRRKGLHTLAAQRGRRLPYPHQVRLLLTVPGRCFEIRKALVGAIMAARDVIEIRTWYSVPDPVLLFLLAAKANQGARVRLMRSARTKVFLADAAAAWADGWLMRYGVQVFHYTAAPLHAKTFRCDSVVLFGSPNLDGVSFYGNHEAAFEARDRALAQTLGEVFDKDLAGAASAQPVEGALAWLKGLLAYLFFPIL